MYDPTAAYMKPLNSGTPATIATPPPSGYDHEPSRTFTISKARPTAWNPAIATSSRPVSSPAPQKRALAARAYRRSAS